MKIVGSLVARNLRLYFRDRALVFYSFLSVLIIIGLYALFLGDVMVSSVEHAADTTAHARFMVDSWIMSGLVLVNAVNVPLMVLDIMVEDRATGRLRDFMASPVRRSHLVAGYLGASWIIGVLMELVTIVLAELYVTARGGELLAPDKMLEAVLVSALCVISYSSVFFFIAQFLRSPSAFSSLCTIVGTLIGFVGGIYIPIGSLPGNVQSVMKAIPVTHSVTLLREIFVSAPLADLLKGAPQSVRDGFARQFGVQLAYGGKVMPDGWLILITLFTGVIFFVLSVIAVSHSGRKER